MSTTGPTGEKPYRKLGELLVAAGVIDELQLRSALGHQRQWGGRIGHILLDLHFIDDLTLARTLAEQLGLELINLRTALLDREVVRHLPQTLAERLLVFPVSFEPNPETGGTLTVAFSDPTNRAGLDEIRFETGKTVQARVATEGEVAWAIRRFYYGEEDTEPVSRPTEPPVREDLFGDGSEILSAPEEEELAELEPIPSDSQVGESSPAATVTAAAEGDPPTSPGDPLQDFFSAERQEKARAVPPSAAPPAAMDTTPPPLASAGDFPPSESVARRPTRPDFLNPLLAEPSEGAMPQESRDAGPAVVAELDAAFERTFALEGNVAEHPRRNTARFDAAPASPAAVPASAQGEAEPPGLSGQALQALIRILVRKGLVSEVEILDELQAAAVEAGELPPGGTRPIRP